MSGEGPFYKKKNSANFYFAVLTDEQPTPAEHPDLPENDPLWALLCQCWSSVPTERPTITEVIASLDGLMERI